MVNVNTHINLYNKNLKSIDVRFNQVKGNFSCSYNHLTSLEGCPEIVEGNYYCNNNKLTTLEGCPKLIKKNFYCGCNFLTLDGLKYLSKVENEVNTAHNFELKELSTIKPYYIFKEKLEKQLIIKENEDLLKLINEKKDKIKTINKL